MKLPREIDFYIKWGAAVIALLHVYLTSNDIAPYYKYTGLLAATLWTTLGVMWRQPSIWLLNGIFVAMYIKGLFV